MSRLLEIKIETNFKVTLSRDGKSVYESDGKQTLIYDRAADKDENPDEDLSEDEPSQEGLSQASLKLESYDDHSSEGEYSLEGLDKAPYKRESHDDDLSEDEHSQEDLYKAPPRPLLYDFVKLKLEQMQKDEKIVLKISERNRPR